MKNESTPKQREERAKGLKKYKNLCDVADDMNELVEEASRVESTPSEGWVYEVKNKSDMYSDKVEELSNDFHAIYQKEAKRQAMLDLDEVRHPDKYDDLPERTKEYDRVLARYVLDLIATAKQETTDWSLEQQEKAYNTGLQVGKHQERQEIIKIVKRHKKTIYDTHGFDDLIKHLEEE